MKAIWIQQSAARIAASLRRVSPEAAGALVSLLVMLVVGTGLSAWSGHLAHRANIARAVAAQETAEQLKAHEAAEAAAAAKRVASEQVAAVQPKPAEVVAPPAARAYPQMGKAFVERFDGTELGERWYVSDGWSNGDWMENDWRASQVKVTSEGLRMTLARAAEGSDKLLSGAEIITNEKFRYGYFEIRMRTPRDPGLVIGAFTFANRSEGARPNEIDIEIVGKNTRKVELTYHQSSKATSKVLALPFDSAAGYHTYAFDWRPDAVRWYADGALIHQETGVGVARLNRPQQYIVSLWASRQLKDWVGELDPSRGPWTLDVSCIAYAPEYPGKRLCTN